MQHSELARAIYVAALTEPDRKAALLEEARRILNGQPPTMDDWVYLGRLKKSVAAAR